MPSTLSFHEIRFPTAISLGASGGPHRRTDVVVLGSGHEQRNSRWAHSRRSWNVGYGVRTLDDLYTVMEFFEERRGRLYGFRWKDPTDWTSRAPSATLTPFDQPLGIGDGSTATFRLAKTYGSSHAPLRRPITKPVISTVVLAVAGVVQPANHTTVNAATGEVTFLSGHIPQGGAAVTAGFEFDCPVRFDTDQLDINVHGFNHGAIPHIPLVEIRA
jgi:uncharacterized protein (TIGR02217 family)